MDRQSASRTPNHTDNHEASHSMDLLAAVMPQRIQTAENALQRQPPPHLPSTLHREIVCLFGGTDFNSAADIRDELIALHCAPSRVGDYISRWRSGLNRLASAGHPFDHADSLRHFVKHLPFGSTYDIIREFVLFNLSTARTADQLPTFESVVERVNNVELNSIYFQPSHSHHLTFDTSSLTVPPSKDTTHTTTPSTNSTSHPRLQRSVNFCTNCRQTGHSIEMCLKPGGGQEGGVTDRTKASARAYIAEVDVYPGNDGGAVLLDSHTSSSSSSGVVDRDTATSFAAFGVIPMALSISELSPDCLPTISHHFNSILDSSCTNHIIRDRSLFWTYHTSLAVPVKTANCGVLETLAKGDVKFRVQCGSHSVVIVLRDCLHAPSAPINLLSVGVMQERRMCIHFDEDATTIHFPSNHPILAGSSIRATLVQRLSFIHCNFIIPTPPVVDGTEVVFPIFPVPEQTPALWHRRRGHLGIE